MRLSPTSGQTLAAATLLAITIISVTHVLTRTPIANAQQQWRLKQLAAVLPTELIDNNPAESVRYRQDTSLGKTNDLAIYTATRNNQPISYVLEVLTPDGYNGNIRLLLGIDVGGTIIGARVIEHRETPGLGDDIDYRKSDWILDFNGQSIAKLAPSRWDVKPFAGHFDAFTGATITPRAVTKAIHQALIWYEANREKMIEP